ncbi:glycosyltransferase family 4 protein [Muricoccus radiodurans]|uniref:glycosyltransferase family 4 protein n=1 Tax=Muricoccus radiodurans TaxID=2231721 RepID=UPI003CE894C7
MTVWLDVEDLFDYALHHARPTGIQRLSFELYAALVEFRGDAVRFCRHDRTAGTLRTVSWEALRDTFAVLLNAAPKTPPAEVATVEEAAPRSLGGILRQAVRRVLPPTAQDSLAKARHAQRRALSSQVEALRHGGRAILSVAAREAGSPAGLLSRASWVGPDNLDLRDEARPGDVLAALGSPWFRNDYAAFVGGFARAQGLRMALLAYDLIPLLHPEWCDRSNVPIFTAWISSHLPLATDVFAISASTARDLEAWSDRTGVPVARPVHVLPIGTGFSGPPVEGTATLPAGLTPGSFVLMVSTVEARKNHLLAFRVWRRLLAEMPPERVPTLVFAGKVGWLVADLMQQLENSAFLGGKVVLLRSPTDADLVALYRGCRFTLYPSLYEGWGLPVTESLSFGKLCIASDRSSVPEAGGDVCLYVDPDNVTAATEVIRRAITDDALIAEREAAIRATFRPTPWRETAETLLAHLSGRAGT